MKTTFLYLLITVSSNAEVHHDYFKTSKACDQAKEIALMGMSAEQMDRKCELTNPLYKQTGHCQINGVEGTARHAECIAVKQ
jgi:hypothetical protein